MDINHMTFPPATSLSHFVVKTVTVKTLRISVKVVSAQLVQYSDVSVRFFLYVSGSPEKSYLSSDEDVKPGKIEG